MKKERNHDRAAGKTSANFSLDKTTLAAVKALAKAERRSASNMAEVLIRTAIEALSKGREKQIARDEGEHEKNTA